MLIERVHFGCVIAHGVRGALTQEFLVFIEVPALFSEAVEAVLLFHAAVVIHAFIGVKDKGAAGDGAVELRPFGVIKPDAERVAIQLQPEGCRAENQFFLRLLNRRNKRSDAGPLPFKQRIQTVLPGCRCQDIGFLRKLFIERRAQADDLIGNKVQFEIRVVRVDQPGILQRLKAGNFRADFHDMTSRLKPSAARRSQVRAWVGDGRRHDSAFSADPAHAADELGPVR